MKRMVLLMMLVLLLTGCAGGNFEQLQDVYLPEESPSPKKISFVLPQDAAAQTLTGSTGKLYFCEGYEVAVEILPGGDMEETLKLLTGCEKENLTLIQTAAGREVCWETAWSAAGEGGQRIGRLLIVDDGNYHYCVSVMADALEACLLQERWEALFASVVLSQ